VFGLEPKVGSLWVWRGSDLTVEKVFKTGKNVYCVTVYSANNCFKIGRDFDMYKFHFLKQWVPCSNLFGLLIGEI
jgi:hypothetical protein